MKNKFGLLGKDIDYSFSRAYFSKKFSSEAIDATYDNFDIESISHFPSILKDHPNIAGMNVTIPYKESVMPFLTTIDAEAKAIGAVNTIKFDQGKLIGFNTDHYGFKKSLQPQLEKRHKRALILGTGGASKAVAYTLRQLDIKFHYVSRNPDFEELNYSDIDEDIIHSYKLIINCTPLGTYPDISRAPNIPYEAISEKHLLFDLIYNPTETIFLKQGKARGANICNGLKMLEYQAEKSWSIWNS